VRIEASIEAGVSEACACTIEAGAAVPKELLEGTLAVRFKALLEGGSAALTSEPLACKFVSFALEVRFEALLGGGSAALRLEPFACACVLLAFASVGIVSAFAFACVLFLCGRVIFATFAKMTPIPLS